MMARVLDALTVVGGEAMLLALATVFLGVKTRNDPRSWFPDDKSANQAAVAIAAWLILSFLLTLGGD